MVTKKNLWGNLEYEQNLRTPYTILQEQADVLTEKTKSRLVGEVFEAYRLSDEFEKELYYSLRIKVPALNYYTYTVLKIRYSPTQLYPVLIIDLTDSESKPHKAENEQEFEEHLQSILSSDRVHHVISVLLSQVRESRRE